MAYLSLVHRIQRNRHLDQYREYNYLDYGYFEYKDYER